MAGEFYALIVMLVLRPLWLIARWYVQRQPEPPASTDTLQRLLKPRTPDDCPAWCRPRATCISTDVSLTSSAVA